MQKKSPYGVPPIESRQEFERNVFLVQEDFERKINGENEELAANAYWSSHSHLKRLRALPNGRVDLMTIDEGLRNMGNMFNWMRMIPRPSRQNPTDNIAEQPGEEL